MARNSSLADYDPSMQQKIIISKSGNIGLSKSRNMRYGNNSLR